jgi:hypothetical protein
VLVVAPVPAAEAQAVGRKVPPSVVDRALPRQGGRKIPPGPTPPKASEEVREAFKKAPRSGPGAGKGAGSGPRLTRAPAVGGGGPLGPPPCATPGRGARKCAPRSPAADRPRIGVGLDGGPPARGRARYARAAAGEHRSQGRISGRSRFPPPGRVHPDGVGRSGRAPDPALADTSKSETGFAAGVESPVESDRASRGRRAGELVGPSCL